MFQYNVTSPQDERLPWVMCFTPALCLLGFWQLLAVCFGFVCLFDCCARMQSFTRRTTQGLAARPSLLRWLRRPRVPTLVQLHAVLTTVFPSGLMLAITSFGTYIEVSHSPTASSNITHTHTHTLLHRLARSATSLRRSVPSSSPPSASRPHSSWTTRPTGSSATLWLASAF